MHNVLIGNTDWAELALWAFFLFFIGLVVYLRREDHREGYPMEDDATGRVSTPTLFRPIDKTFILAHGMGTVRKPGKRGIEPVNPATRRMSPYSGAPIEPTGNPLLDGVGPAAWCNRLDVPDMRWEGGPKIVPLDQAHGFRIARGDKNPIGMPVFGCDDVMGGVCTNVWVDQSERLIRYIEVRTLGDGGAEGRTVVVPVTMTQIRQRAGKIKVDAVRADQFGAAPVPASPNQITRLEEEKVMGYFGGGYLYAKRSRLEPFL